MQRSNTWAASQINNNGRKEGKERGGGWIRGVSLSQASPLLFQSPPQVSTAPPSLPPSVPGLSRLTLRSGPECSVGQVQCEVRVMAQTGVRVRAQAGAEAEDQSEAEHGPPALPGGAHPVLWGHRCWLLQEPSITPAAGYSDHAIPCSPSPSPLLWCPELPLGRKPAQKAQDIPEHLSPWQPACHAIPNTPNLGPVQFFKFRTSEWEGPPRSADSSPSLLSQMNKLRPQWGREGGTCCSRT